MKTQNKKNGFTLIEILVGIAILSFLLLAVSSIDFNRLSQKQKLDIFTNNIKSNFEIVRNYSLSGKGIGANLDIPNKWSIDYSNTGSGVIVSNSFSGSILTEFQNLTFEPGYSISSLRCLQLDKTENNNIVSGTGSIEIIGQKIDLTGECSSSTSKILELTVSYRQDSKILQINTLNGLVEIQ